MTSSGYGSQAVSTLTLSSEDSASIKSIEENTESSRQHSVLQSTDSEDLDEHQPKGHEEDKQDGDLDTVPIASKAEEQSSIFSLPQNPPISTSSAQLTFDDQKVDMEDGRKTPRAGEDDEEEADDEAKKAEQVQYNEGCTAEGDNDLYSLNAMEELEKLGEEDEEEDEDADVAESSKFKEPEMKSHIVQKPIASPHSSQNDGKTAVSASSTGDSQKDTNAENKTNAVKASSFLSASSQNKGDKFHSEKEDNKSPGDKKTVTSNKQKRLGVRPRPMSMIVSPHTDMMTRAWQDGGYSVDRNSSEELLSGNTVPIILQYHCCISALCCTTNLHTFKEDR